jgi:hypothetical protein
MSLPAFDEVERRRFVADPEALAVLGMSIADLADPDARALMIRQGHPELQAALRDGLDEVDLGHGPVNPRLHLTMHEIVANQLWDDDPREVWETAVRLRDAGYEREEILHMLMRPMSDQVWAAMQHDEPYNRARHVAALRALPESWERERTARSASERHESGRKQARRAARSARRRNRRPK